MHRVDASLRMLRRCPATPRPPPHTQDCAMSPMPCREALPGLRRRLRRDLAKPGYRREKVLAIVVALLGETLVRVGNPEYARENRSYGLTTLRNRHVEFLRGGRARFRFRGKGGLDHEV